jgi:hypothetical protein
MATEKRLIDANELLRIYKKWIPQLALPEDEGDKRGVETCIAVLEDQPTVDAVEVVHGEWDTIVDDYCGLVALKCSVCNTQWWFEDDASFGKYHYCPYCGAEMKKEVHK